ncbi:hypothetical protein TNCV_3070631 [Trichonephila clavipes]|nr:hypothetical protein TNCV_3070631 [Trichonephila clavipes]
MQEQNLDSVWEGFTYFTEGFDYLFLFSPPKKASSCVYVDNGGIGKNRVGEQLAPGSNRSNERRDRKGSGNDGEKRSERERRRDGEEEKAGVVKSRHGWTMYEANPVTSEYILDFKEMSHTRIANQSANQNNGQTSRVKSLDEIVKMVRLLTVKVPNKSDGWEYFFSSLEKAFASEMVSDELKPKGKFYDEPERAKWNGSKRRSFNGSWGKQPFGEKEKDR